MRTLFTNVKRRTAIIAVLCMIFALVPANGFAYETSDFLNHWAKDKIQSWMGRDLMKGYEDGTFRPDNNITRAEFMSLVNSAFGYSESTAINYSDIGANAWYAAEIAKAKAANYISGYPDNTMKPDNPISRAEAASIIMKINKLGASSSDSIEFIDESSFGWSKNAVNAVSAVNIMNGYPDGSFKPQEFIKRAEAVVALDKALAYNKNNITYSKAGVYGPVTGVLEVEGNVTVTERGITLQNMIIKGNLIIEKNVGDGNITLDSVAVKGETKIYGGGQNSIAVINSTLGKVTVSKEDGKIRIVISGNTTINEVVANSGVKLEEKNLTAGSEGFQEIVLDASENDVIILLGSFSQVDVKTEGLEIQVPKGTTVDTIVLNERARITGSGTILQADVNASGVTFETAPKSTDVAKGVTEPKVGATTTSGGGNGGGASSSSSIPVSAITVTGAGDAATVANGGTLQMSAAVAPVDATNKTVTWSITNGTGTATIDTNGLLTATKEGTVRVKATAKDGSGKFGERQITVTANIVKETPVVNTPVAAIAVNAGQTLADSILSGTFKDSKDINVAGTLAWDSPATAVGATGNFAWTFTPADTAKYNVVKGTVSVTANIVKETPVVNTPVASTAVNAGQTLADSILSGTFKDSKDMNVAGTLAWDSPATAVGATGNFAWTFTPADTAKYNVVKGSASVTINILKITYTPTPGLQEGTVSVFPGAAVGALTITGGIEPVTYVLAPGNGTNDTDNSKFVISGTKLTVGSEMLKEGTYSVYVEATDGGGHKVQKEITVIVEQSERTRIAIIAINTARYENMDMTIKSEAAILGLDLTDYSNLKSKEPVWNAMVALENADKMKIHSTFNEAVAAQKSIEDQAAVDAEATNYETAVTVGRDVIAGSCIDGLIMKLKPGRISERVDRSYAPTDGTYLMVKAQSYGEEYYLKAQKLTEGDATENAVVTFTKGGKSATLTIVVTIQSQVK